MFDVQLLAKKKGPIEFVSGVDEVGRGPLAGPVVSASVVLLNQRDLTSFCSYLKSLNVIDSKKISSLKRKKILSELGIHWKIGVNFKSLKKKIVCHKANVSWAYSVVAVSPQMIDKINILNASLLSMNQATKKALSCFDLSFQNYGLLMIDGKFKCKINSSFIEEVPIIKGDQLSLLIGLASIIAKELRDDYMSQLDEIYPGYGFSGHAGYPTKSHKSTIQSKGVLSIHRKTFRGVKEFL